MISSKKLIRIARKWRKIAATGRKRISLPRNSSSVADKGHFVVYSTDQIRFVIPLVYLQNTVFRELFKMSEEEFGLPRDGPIMLPCDPFIIEYILSLTRRGLARDLEQALLFSISSTRCSLPFVHRQEMGKQVVVCG